MKTLKNIHTHNRKENTWSRIFQAVMIVAMLFIASDIYAQNKEVEFEVYTTSATKATQYLLADDVALRDCAAVQCEQLTTLKIGTKVRLLAKSNIPNTINGVTSRWYKVQMGPEIGWIWGGLISQKTMISEQNPGVKFVFGEAGVDFKGYKRFQIRAIKNGEEVDKIFVKSETLRHELVSLFDDKNKTFGLDIISLCPENNESCSVEDSTSYIVFKDNKLMQTNSLAVFEKAKTNKTSVAVSCDVEFKLNE